VEKVLQVLRVPQVVEDHKEITVLQDQQEEKVQPVIQVLKVL
jgi:hypothetical protein